MLIINYILLPLQLYY